MGVPIVTALACTVLVALGDGGDADAIRARGRAALARYLDAAPEERRDALRERSELQAMMRAFEENDVSNHAR